VVKLGNFIDFYIGFFDFNIMDLDLFLFVFWSNQFMCSFFLFLTLYNVLIEQQGGPIGNTSSPIVELEDPEVHHGGTPLQTLTPANAHIDDSCDVEEDEANKEDLVSFDDVMDAADRAVDAFESSVMSRVSDTNARRRRERAQRIVMMARARPFRLMSPESSDTKYSSESQVSISIDGPAMQDLRDDDCSQIQGRQQVVIIHLSSDSEMDVDID
jgi:hypothetical protein